MKRIDSIQKNKYRVDAFFAGVGGIELGFEQTGKFKTVYANEFDKNARITYKINHPDVPLDGCVPQNFWLYTKNSVIGENHGEKGYVIGEILS